MLHFGAALRMLGRYWWLRHPAETWGIAELFP